MLIGAVVFIMWLGLDRWSGGPAAGTIGKGVAALPPAGRIIWLTVRTVAASLTVPIAEELAFRGFLLRRFISPEFETVDWRKFTWFSFLASSLLFGAMHGGRWIAGTLAGMLYAVAMLRRGRMGDAVAAHGTTNALLAAWVLARGEWWLW